MPLEEEMIAKAEAGELIDRGAGPFDLADMRLRPGFFAGLAFGQFLVVVGAAWAVPVADLGDPDHVDRVVEPAVAAPAQPVDLAAAGGELDRRSAVVGREVIAAGEAGQVADIAKDRGGGDRAIWIAPVRMGASASA